MSEYSSLKATINANVKTNGNQEITGSIMNSVLNAMVDSLGAGYQFMGVATPTNPGTAQTPDYKCFYLATTPGTYTNLGGLIVNDGEVAILKYDLTWHKEATGIASADKLNQLSLDMYDKSWNAPFAAYQIFAQNVSIPAGVVIYNTTNSPIGVWERGASSYVTVLKYSYYIVVTEVVKMHNLGTASVGGKVYIVGKIDNYINTTRTVDAIIDKSRNLFNPNGDGVESGYLNPNGDVTTSSSYKTSGYIPVKPNTTYCFSTNGVLSVVRFVLELSSEKKSAYYHGDTLNTFTTGAGTYFIRFSGFVGSFPAIQMEEGSVPPSYVAFSEKIKSEYIPETPTPPTPPTPSVVQSKFDSIRLNGILATNGTLSYDISIYKAIMLSARIVGTIESVVLAIGYNGYYGRWFELTPTDIKIYDHNGLRATKTHGLTLGNITTLELSKNDGGVNIDIRLINDYGEIYTTTYNAGYGAGAPSLINLGAASIDASLSIFPRDLNARIWGFGDSYFSFQDPARWTYYALDCGYNKWLINSVGGQTSTSGLTQFMNLIATGAVPTYVLWCYGMNDGSDSTTPDATWLANTESFIDECEDNGVIPILATIPSIPSKDHSKKNAWIRASGYRYIDFAAFVESQNDNYWRGWGTDDQLLGNDETHPTQKGAKVLWQAVLKYFPEIATNY